MDRILDAAEELFLEVGYHAATTNQIAQRARTSIGSIYEYFANKEAIGGAIAQRYESELVSLYGPVVEGPEGLDDMVDDVVDVLVEFGTRHRGYWTLMRDYRRSLELKEQGGQYLERVVDRVERSVASSQPDPDRRRAVATTFATVLDVMLDDLTIDPPRTERVAELKVLLRSYLSVAVSEDA